VKVGYCAGMFPARAIAPPLIIRSEVRPVIRALFRSLMLVMLITASAHAGSSAFLMTLGRDTLAIERSRDEGGRIAGVTLFRPTGTRVDWTLVLARRRPRRAVHDRGPHRGAGPE
jgi:hypothetical protein